MSAPGRRKWESVAQLESKLLRFPIMQYLDKLKVLRTYCYSEASSEVCRDVIVQKFGTEVKNQYLYHSLIYEYAKKMVSGSQTYRRIINSRDLMKDIFGNREQH